MNVEGRICCLGCRYLGGTGKRYICQYPGKPERSEKTGYHCVQREQKGRAQWPNSCEDHLMYVKSGQ